MAIGKTRRFEIFKRDGFTCQYCGSRPPDVILEVDHIIPIAGDGTDDDVNLITACFNCNRGKRDRKLENTAPKPDADIAYLKVQQEIVETERYLRSKAQRDLALEDVVVELKSTWSDYLTAEYAPFDTQFKRWLLRYSPDEIEAAIKASSNSYHAGKFGDSESTVVRQLIPYVSAVMRDKREDAVPLLADIEFRIYEAYQDAFKLMIEHFGKETFPEEIKRVFRPLHVWLDEFYDSYKKRLSGEESSF